MEGTYVRCFLFEALKHTISSKTLKAEKYNNKNACIHGLISATLVR
jgi:hypothetical protein